MSVDASGPEGSEIQEVSPTDLNQRLKAGDTLILLDVRQGFERDPDHGQLHIPMAEIGSRIDEIDPEKTTVVYCRSGGRSGQVVQYLQQKGFADVINLAGGVLGWRDQVDPSLTAY